MDLSKNEFFSKTAQTAKKPEGELKDRKDVTLVSRGGYF